MAKKKVSQQEKPPKQENPNNTMEDSSEKLASLKSLNSLLLKETVERRQQVDALLQSKAQLESQISRSAFEKQRLEAQKNVLEDETIVADLERSLALSFVSSQLNQQVERLKNEIWRENEELRAQSSVFKAKLEERIRDEGKRRKAAEAMMMQQQREIDQVSNDFRSYRDRVQKDLDLKQEEADRLRSIVVDLEKSNAEVIGRMQMERDGVAKEMAEMVEKFMGLKRKMADAVRERDEIEQARIEREREIDLLKKSVDVLTANLSREKDAFNRVLREKDLIRKDLDIRIEEVDGLKSKLLDLEKTKSDTEEKLWKLQKDRKELLEEKEQRERSLESLVSDKASMERSLVESSQVIKDFKRENRELVADKEQLKQEMGVQEVKIIELQKEVGQLSATISSLQNQEKNLQLKISELGKSNADALKKQEHLLMEVNELGEEKRERERRFDELKEEESSTRRSLQESMQQLEVQKIKMEEIVLEKAEIEQVKIKLEAEMIELHKEVGKLSAAVSTLQESCREHEENSGRLQLEAIHHRDALERVSLERNDALKELDQEKKELSSLSLKILELEKSVEETKEEFVQLSTERDALVKEKKERESNLQLLIEDKALLQRTLLEAQQGLKDMQVKMKSVNLFSERTLSMLKDTTALVCGPDDEEKDGKVKLVTDAENFEDEILPFASKLEAIKRAFREREGKEEDMSQQLKSLQNSVMAVQKKRSFWAWLSSITTIFAAASMAYAAKGR